MNFVIVVIGYNRPASLGQLLESLARADYLGDRVDLVVSIDDGKNQPLSVKTANNFRWDHGSKTVVVRQERMGLKRHVLTCGDYAYGYDALIMLEDDLLVAGGFYAYAKQVLAYYADCEVVAGVSLYKHETHTGTFRPFEPMRNQHDVFLMRFAQSWGQCWTKKMWDEFRKWYLCYENCSAETDDTVPDYIMSWKQESWLKHFMRYLSFSNKFFVYPYCSLSTNCSQAGEHNAASNDDFQVSMLQAGGQVLPFRLAPVDALIKYDMHYERIDLNSPWLERFGSEVILDLNGSRSSFPDSGYAVSTASLPYDSVCSIGLRYRPIEANCILPMQGRGITVYDLSKPGAAKKIDRSLLARYQVRAQPWSDLLIVAFRKIEQILCIKTFSTLERFFHYEKK